MEPRRYGYWWVDEHGTEHRAIGDYHAWTEAHKAAERAPDAESRRRVEVRQVLAVGTEPPEEPGLRTPPREPPGEGDHVTPELLAATKALGGEMRVVAVISGAPELTSNNVLRSLDGDACDAWIDTIVEVWREAAARRGRPYPIAKIVVYSAFGMHKLNVFLTRGIRNGRVIRDAAAEQTSGRAAVVRIFEKIDEILADLSLD